jgi:hypothetical protein
MHGANYRKREREERQRLKRERRQLRQRTKNKKTYEPNKTTVPMPGERLT